MLAKTQQILIIEKDESFRKVLHLELSYKGFSVDMLSSDEISELYKKPTPIDRPLVLIGLEFQAAQEMVQRLRNHGNDAWFIILSKQLTLQEKIQLLEYGADDYLVHPFAVEELIAKITVILRRNQKVPKNGVLSYEDLRMNLIQRTVFRANRQIELRSKEFELLKIFLLHPEETLSREFIFDSVWGSNFLGDSNVIEVYIRYLRAKLFKPIIIKTKRGKGYILISDEAQVRRANMAELEHM